MMCFRCQFVQIYMPLFTFVWLETVWICCSANCCPKVSCRPVLRTCYEGRGTSPESEVILPSSSVLVPRPLFPKVANAPVVLRTREPFTCLGISFVDPSTREGFLYLVAGLPSPTPRPFVLVPLSSCHTAISVPSISRMSIRTAVPVLRAGAPGLEAPHAATASQWSAASLLFFFPNS